MDMCWAYVLPDPEHSLTARVVLVVAYVVAAACWLSASRRVRAASSGSFSRWWFFGALLLFLLAINKQFDLRDQCAVGIRALAKAQDWYNRRQPVQFALAIVLPSVLAIVAGAFLVTRCKVFFRSHPLALCGWVLLLLYLALRQAQEWKPAYRWLSSIRYHDWRLALEAAGILLVVLAAVRARPPPPK
jgi:hypothetical protein